ncbi:MAG TPA: hypothetical protein VEM13_02255 [Gemmatimonadales bacterium]|nr:hypothetical protein [Gemmatimonadales bacterium]
MLGSHNLVAAKAWLAGTGLAIGLAGMATARRWLVWIALALVAVAFLLRFAERGKLNRS